MAALYTKDELAKKSLPELRELATITHDLEFDSEKPTRAVATKALLEIDAPDEDELDDDEELDDEDEVDDDELEPEDDGDIELDDDELDDEELDEEVDIVVPDKKPTKAAAAKVAKAKADHPSARPKLDKIAKAEANGEPTLAAKQVATALGTEAKTLRQFFRSDASTIEAVGSGGRYEFLTSDLEQIKTEFEAWTAAHASRGSKRGSTPKGKAAASAPVVEEVEEIEELEELEDEIDDEIDDEELELDDDDLELDD